MESGGSGRYSDVASLVLASLVQGPRHGHAMLDDIAAMAGYRPGPGTLYGAIARLEQQGLIEPLATLDRRQPYRLTAAGHAAHTAHLATLERIIAFNRRQPGLA